MRVTGFFTFFRRPAAFFILAIALAACEELEPQPEGPPPVDTVAAVIDISDQTMTLTRTYVAEKKTEKYTWDISTGRKGYETPTGRFRPFFLSKDHKSSLYDDAPMPWSVFFNGDIAVHGTTELRNLGRPASHGCVRAHPKNAQVFFQMVQQVGKANTTVTVVP
ncbi:MAG: L,D-transpeptidase [Maritimibacter sp.]